MPPSACVGFKILEVGRTCRTNAWIKIRGRSGSVGGNSGNKYGCGGGGTNGSYGTSGSTNLDAVDLRSFLGKVPVGDVC